MICICIYLGEEGLGGGMKTGKTVKVSATSHHITSHHIVTSSQPTHTFSDCQFVLLGSMDGTHNWVEKLNCKKYYFFVFFKKMLYLSLLIPAQIDRTAASSVVSAPIIVLLVVSVAVAVTVAVIFL